MSLTSPSAPPERDTSPLKQARTDTVSPTPSTDDVSGSVGDTDTEIDDAAALAGATGPMSAMAATTAAEKSFTRELKPARRMVVMPFN
jgi:hypothetical protein